MLRIVVTICALSQLATALPQVGRQLGSGGPRPVSYGGSQGVSPSQSFGPNYSQQLSFGGNSAQPLAQIAQTQTASPSASPQIRSRGPSTYQSPQPIIISQANPSASPATPTAFASFPGGFGGAGRQILTLRSPQGQADEDEYEYEDEEEPQRPTPRPIPVTRAPVRVAQPTQSSFGGPGRFSQPQQQQQQHQQRQRQPIPQQQFPVQQQQQQQQRGQSAQDAPRPGSSVFGIDGKRSRLTTPPPVQTVNRYMKQNDDGSITWGYENEDGTFKEETLGADCVVRGKYGYVDPEGNKREYEYQTGNPCDPNKKDQEEVEEEEDIPDGPSRPQQLAGVLNARPRPVQRRPQQHQQQQYQAQPQYQIS
ncbi:hypothetical protein Ocin01_06024 [Orchesella cincta]|uniref:Uncharacterized protein n=1 Tax=Orchesella cincta TaxID=48709 RepID=A0A1D2N5W2_ORCCI|nr:hypothetical protein Ocin01_06024 [Orchesella cincta]